MTQVKDKDEKTLTYAQFAAALNVVAATLFPKVRSQIKSDRGSYNYGEC